MNPEEQVPYATAVDFDRALTDRIASAAASSPYRVSQLRRHFAYGRLLTRLFLHQPERWVLKGATGLLARLPEQARHSIDVDLYFAGEVEGAIDSLREAADLDLGDFFTFDIQPGPRLAGATAGAQLGVTSYLGDKVFETFRIDVVVTLTMTAEPEPAPPLQPVKIPGLRSITYRTYPMADQIADKYAAIIHTYAGRPSTRYRDLVDLVLIATTQAVSADRLHTALMSECRRRGIAPKADLTLPSGQWREGYHRIAAEAPGFAYLDAAQAIEIVQRLVGPVVAGRRTGTWDPALLEWETQ